MAAGGGLPLRMDRRQTDPSTRTSRRDSPVGTLDVACGKAIGAPNQEFTRGKYRAGIQRPRKLRLECYVAKGLTGESSWSLRGGLLFSRRDTARFHDDENDFFRAQNPSPSCARAMTAGRWLSKRGKYVPLVLWLNCKDCFERNEPLLVSGA